MTFGLSERDRGIPQGDVEAKTTLRGDEPWPGYDDLSVEKIRAVLNEADEERIKRSRSYERSHRTARA